MIDVQEGGAWLSDVLERANWGEEIVLAVGGEPVARLVPYPSERTEPRVPGRLAGQVVMAPDFDETPEDIIAAFEGRSEPPA